MTAKPTSKLDWGGTKVEPTAGQKTAGFAPGNRPPAEWWNWQLGNVDQWLKYLDEFSTATDADVTALDTSLRADIATLDTELDTLTLKHNASIERTALQNPRASVLPVSPNSYSFSGAAIHPPTGRIVLVGNGGGSPGIPGFISNNMGTTWTANSMTGTVTSHQSIIWVGTHFVSGGSGVIATSPDGLGVWTTRLSAGSQWVYLAYRPATGHMVAASAIPNSPMYYSADRGLTWTATANEQYPRAVVTDSGYPFFGPSSMAGTTTVNTLRKSDNGNVWSDVNLSAYLASDERCAQVAISKALGVVCSIINAVGAPIGILISKDLGLTWTRHNGIAALNLTGTPYYRLYALSALYLIVNAGAATQMYFSYDGSTWDYCADLYAYNVGQLRLIPNGSGYVAIRDMGNNLGNLNLSAWTY